jgi:hypothetical protein
VARILNKNQVKWFVDMGTLLGLVRDGDFIPWDNDIDIATLHDDLLAQRLLRCCEELESAGYDVSYCDKSMSVIKSGWFELNLAVYELVGREYRYEYLKPVTMASARHGLQMVSKRKYFYHRRSHRANLLRRFFMSRELFSAICYVFLNIALGKLEYKSVKVDQRHFRILKSCDFLGVQLAIPADPESYLESRYGANWRVPRRDWVYFKDDRSITIDS